jgi:hypothetical protein
VAWSRTVSTRIQRPSTSRWWTNPSPSAGSAAWRPAATLSLGRTVTWLHADSKYTTDATEERPRGPGAARPATGSSRAPCNMPIPDHPGSAWAAEARGRGRRCREEAAGSVDRNPRLRVAYNSRKETPHEDHDAPGAIRRRSSRGLALVGCGVSKNDHDEPSRTSADESRPGAGADQNREAGKA